MSNKNELKLEPVFRLKPQRNDDTAMCEIKFVDYISQTDKLGDEPIELETTEDEKKSLGSFTHYMGKFNGYDITVNAYRNNITGNYMLSSKNLPVCSLQFMYAKNIVVGYLFNIFIYFCIDPLKNPHLSNSKAYLNSKIVGNYILILDSDKELIDNMHILLDTKIEDYVMEDIAKMMVENDELNVQLSEEVLLEKIQKNMEEKRGFYEMLIKGREIKDFKTIKKFTDDYLVPLYENPHISGLINFALDIRSKKRVKEYKSFEGEYKIPEKFLNLNDIKNNPDLVDKYIGITDDTDSD